MFSVINTFSLLIAIPLIMTCCCLLGIIIFNNYLKYNYTYKYNTIYDTHGEIIDKTQTYMAVTLTISCIIGFIFAFFAAGKCEIETTLE